MSSVPAGALAHCGMSWPSLGPGTTGAVLFPRRSWKCSHSCPVPFFLVWRVVLGEGCGQVCPWGRGEGSQGPELSGSLQALPVKVTAGKVRLEDRKRLEQEQQSEEKRLAIMMMKKREKYLYKKIMFGKKRKVREV